MRAVFASEFPNMRLESGAPLLLLAPRNEFSMKTLMPQVWKQKGAKPDGVFQGGWEKRYAVVRLDAMSSGDYRVVYHEYVHSLLHLNFRWLPLWLDEGLAEYYGNTRFEASQVFLGSPPLRVTALHHSALIPLHILFDVNQASPYYRDEDKVNVFYAESWGLVHFLILGSDMQLGKRFNQFCKSLQQGADQKEAFQQAFGDTKLLEDKLDNYVRNYAFHSGVIDSPPELNEKAFASRRLTNAEIEAELGSYHLLDDLTDAGNLIEHALKDDPKLGLAYEDKGFLDFSDGKDDDAAQDFAKAIDLDAKLYLSMYYRTMLLPLARSDAAVDQASFRSALLKTLDLNPQFAPAYVQLARLYVRQGDLARALAVARKAEELEPSRAGYHLLSGQILLRMGHDEEAAAWAKFVADRWYGSDHDEALELWTSVPKARRPAGEPRTETVPKSLEGTQVAEGWIKSTTCEKESKKLTVGLDHDGQQFVFRGTNQSGGFSDTIWYGEEHFSFCHHIEGMRAIVHYKPSSDKNASGELVGIEVRDELPESGRQVGEKIKADK
jgi:Tfp pilus assembly protein PilF